MNIKDYIQGKRHGREANQLEREAMNDSFLQDAIDGYDSVQGNHLPIIEELERKIEKKSKKKVLLIRYATIGIAASVALLIGINLIFYQNKPNVREIAKVNEVLSEIALLDTVEQKDIAQNQTSNFEIKNGVKSTPTPSYTKKPKAEQINVIENVLIQNDVDADFISDSDEINEVVSVNKTNLVADAFETAKNDTTSSDKSVNLKFKGISSLASNNLITGKVVDQDGNPIIGASVYYDKSKNGTVTDLDGQFTLPKIENQKLMAKYIGYQPKIIDIKEDSNIIQLQPDNLALNEVVAVGYGSKSKKATTGTVSTIENRTTSRVTGVQIKNTSQNETFEQEEFKQFILKNLKHNICEGNVYTLTASFRTDKTGKPYDVKIISSNCSEFEQEFLRIIKLSPEWTSVNKKIIFTITKP
jgi:hypothetical protein